MTNRKQKTIERANAYVVVNMDLRKAFHSRWNRCYALVYSDGKVREAKATKRGAESRKKELVNNTFIGINGRMTDCGSHLEIVEITEDDLLPLDSCQLWYNTMWYEYRHLGGMSFNFKKFYYIIDKYELPEQLKKAVEKYGKMAEKGEFKPIDKYEKNKIDLEGF